MSRRYEEPVEVRRGEPLLGLPAARGEVLPAAVPTAFVWRGRLHVVREVVDHWTQRLPWWRTVWSDEGDGGGAQDEAPLALAELEQEVWRVVASAGRCLGTGVYDLVRDDRPTTADAATADAATAERWRLVRVAD